MLDAIGIAGQTLVAAQIGARQEDEAMRLTRIAGRAGLCGGTVIGIGLMIAGWCASPLFSQSIEIQHLLTVGMVVVGVTLPLAGWMWAVDGILIGAGDYRYLALTCAATAAIYVPCLAAIGRICDAIQASSALRMALLWLAVNLLFVGLRAIFNGFRIGTSTWLHIRMHLLSAVK